VDRSGLNEVELNLDGIIKEKRRAALASVFAGLGLTVIKLAAGLATGSLGILAEAAHSALDAGAAFLTLFAVKTSWRPPDADHHYGHGKVENLSALAQTVLLMLASFWILQEAVERIIDPSVEVKPSVWAFGVIIISIVVDIVRSRDLSRVAKKSGSQALEADALHFSTDILSSGVVLLGLGAVVVGRSYDIPWLHYADSGAAIVVALVVLMLCWKLGRRSIDMLMDRAPQGMLEQVQAVLVEIEGTTGAVLVRIRQAGDRLFADVEIGIAPGLPMAEGERVAELARERVRSVIGENGSVLIQLRGRWEEAASIREQIATAVTMEGVQGHNITVRRTGDNFHADMHLELSGELTLLDGHEVADKVEATILRRVPQVSRVDIHLELHDDEPDREIPMDEKARAWFEKKIFEVSAQVAGEGAVHDLLLARTEAGLYLSCHCYLPGGTSLHDAHEITDRLEKALYHALPELNRVAVHAEPESARS